MNPADAASLLRIFDVLAEPLDDGRWQVRVPWADGTPLITGEYVQADEVVALASAIVTTYADPTRRQHFRADLLRYLAEELTTDSSTAW